VPVSDGVGEALELHTLFVKLAHQVHEVLDASSQPIKFPNDQSVTFAQRFIPCPAKAACRGKRVRKTVT